MAAAKGGVIRLRTGTEINRAIISPARKKLKAFYL